MQHTNKPLPGQKSSQDQTQIGPNVEGGLKSKAQAYLQQAQQGLHGGGQVGTDKPKVDVGGGDSLDKRRASVLVSSFGRKVADLAKGIVQTGALKHPGTLEALGKLLGKDKAEQVWKQAAEDAEKSRVPQKGDFEEKHKILDKHLKDTGRDSDSKEALEKREVTTGTILQGIEKATLENQEMRDKVKKPAKPTPRAHPFSAHGKGSNQVARLVSGHRGDEVDSLKGSDEVELTGNLNGLGTTKVPKVDTVGSAPSNTTGAFTTNVGMLHVVNEAFAQAGMLDRYVDQEKRSGNKSSLNEGRFAPNVKGPGGKIGEGLEVTGVSKQKTGVGLSKDELQERFKNVKSTGDQTNARMVLDPAFDEKGARIGWNLQTAYANNDAPTTGYATTKDVAESPAAKRQKAVQLGKDVEAQAKTVSELETKISGIPKLVENKKKGLPGRLKKAEAAEKKAGELPEGEAKVKALAEAKLARSDYDKLDNEIKSLEGDGKVELENQLVKAKEKHKQLELELKAAEDIVAKLPAEKPQKEGGEDEGGEVDNEDEGGGGGQLGGQVGGYDGKLGQWKGGRPGKPPGSDQLKGKDESGNNLTAHHLYPWNKIESDLNSALAGKSVSAMQKLLDFAGETVSDEFWKELAKEPKDRSYAFAEELNRVVPHICWSPSNVFMGPSGRGDDPGEEIDSTTGNGKPTHQSALAELLGKSGGLRDVKGKVDDDPLKSPLENSKANREHSQGRLAEMLLRNLRDNGQGGTTKGTAKPYDPKEWTKDKSGAPIQKTSAEPQRKWTKDETSGKPKLAVPVVTPPAPKDDKKTTKKKGGSKV